MYKNRFSQLIQSRKDFNNRTNYTKNDTNNCESMRNTTFLNSWIYKRSEESITRLKSEEERQHIIKRNKNVDEKEWNWRAI